LEYSTLRDLYSWMLYPHRSILGNTFLVIV
jgi:hypothetical protein